VLVCHWEPDEAGARDRVQLVVIAYQSGIVAV
jgi:hypothetical protein